MITCMKVDKKDKGSDFEPKSKKNSLYPKLTGCGQSSLVDDASWSLPRRRPPPDAMAPPSVPPPYNASSATSSPMSSTSSFMNTPSPGSSVLTSSSLSPPIAARTRQQSDSALTMPMVQVMGPDGNPGFVYRPWTTQDLIDAASHLPKPAQGGAAMARAYVQFIKDFTPTSGEIQRVMMKYMKPSDFSKVKDIFPRDGDFRPQTVNWDTNDNADLADRQYQDFVTQLGLKLVEVSPAHCDLAKVNACCQKEEACRGDAGHGKERDQVQEWDHHQVTMCDSCVALKDIGQRIAHNSEAEAEEEVLHLEAEMTVGNNHLTDLRDEGGEDQMRASHKNCEPVIVTPKSDYRPKRVQYPLRPEAVDGIKPVFKSLLEAGVIIPCNDSPVCTPIFPVQKAREPPSLPEWRFVQDLKAVNAAVHARTPSVPNPYTLLSQVPSFAKWFSVVDLSNAFFSVPVHKDSQYWFAFQFNGKGYTFTRLCQGFTESPTIYNQALCESLLPLALSDGTALLQYVDDLLICAPTEKQCITDTIKLLKHLAEEGHKASLNKLQFVRQAVTFLGHIISGEGKTMSPKHIEAIQKIPKPITQKQMLSFLGMCSYCRAFVPNFSEVERPLRTLCHQSGMTSRSQLEWTPEADTAFLNLKLQLQSPPTLGLPDPTKPFTQTVDERSGCMTSVLLQPHGDRLRPVAYFSGKLAPVAAGMPKCLRAVAAAEKALLASRDIVGYALLTLLVPHAVSLILSEQKTSHLSAARHLRYHTCLLDMPNVTLKRCTVLNPATLLPLPQDGEPHDCMAELSASCSPRPDLTETPLTNPDLVLYVDGSASRDPVTGLCHVGFAVCSDYDVMMSSSLPPHFSAQAAELVALTTACQLAKGRSVNIYTDSRYAFGVVHDFGALWKHRGFLKSDGKPVLHHTLIADLLDAILLPSAISVCKCAAHTNASDPISTGNARADAAAQAASLLPLSNSSVSHTLVSVSSDVPSSLSAVQSFASPKDKQLWRNAGASCHDGIWIGPDNNPCLPSHFFPHYAKLTHGSNHASKGGMQQMINTFWFTKGFSAYAQKHCQACVICATHNVGRAIQPSQQAAHPQPTRPFEHVMMDFVELTPSEGKSHCLVMVDMWSKWVEVFPASKQSASVVAKALLTEIIPRWGIPAKISSDNGSHFVNSAITELSLYLGINLRTHCAYHPASGGAVERENGTLKNKLAKCCEDTGLPWTKALPLVLMYMRMRKRNRTNLSPFEILFATPPSVGVEAPRSPPPSTALCDHNTLTYCTNLSKQLSDVKKQVIAALPVPASGPLHQLEPGDFVVIKDFRRKSWRNRRWQGPFQILLTTHTAVKVAERATWIHASHCRKVPAPPAGAPGKLQTPEAAK
uniref:protein NYNRIN-like n=1 Tax=Solea senegalensis TaxID=28829 RepID=UPI001CD916DA|nr:protein NYNRIN-like [Solea senegalensis]